MSDPIQQSASDLPKTEATAIPQTLVTLDVSNLPHRAEWQDVSSLFRNSGRVVRCVVMTDRKGRSQRRATVVMASLAEAHNAFEMYHQFNWMDSVLNVTIQRGPALLQLPVATTAPFTSFASSSSSSSTSSSSSSSSSSSLSQTPVNTISNEVYELRGHVFSLREELDHERTRHHMTEARLRSASRLSMRLGERLDSLGIPRVSRGELGAVTLFRKDDGQVMKQQQERKELQQKRRQLQQEQHQRREMTEVVERHKNNSRTARHQRFAAPPTTATTEYRSNPIKSTSPSTRTSTRASSSPSSATSTAAGRTS